MAPLLAPLGERSVDPIDPVMRAATLVCEGDDVGVVLMDDVDDAVAESFDRHAPDLSPRSNTLDRDTRVRPLADQFPGAVSCSEQCMTQPRLTLLEPAGCVEQLAARLAVNDNRTGQLVSLSTMR